MGALGDLNQYMKFQTAEAIRDAAQNTGGGLASMGAGMGAGAGIGKVMADAMASPNPSASQVQESQAEMMDCVSCGAKNRKGPKFCSERGFSFIKKCISCGHEIDPNAKFCMECGASQVVESRCPHCDEKIDPGAKFCPHCGQSTKA